MLADFIVNFTPNVVPHAEKELLNLTEHSTSKWTLSIDGSSNINRSGIALVLTSLEGDLIQQAISCGFCATNNEVEYEALTARLILAKDMGMKKPTKQEIRRWHPNWLMWRPYSLYLKNSTLPKFLGLRIAMQML